MIRDQEKVTEKGKFGPHTLPISGRSPCRDTGCLLALAGRYKPLTRLPFWGLPSVITRHQKLQSRAPHLLPAGHDIHSHRHTEDLVKQKTWILRKQRV